VTGAGRDSGEGIAKALARQGAAVVVNGRRVEPLERVVGEIVAAGGRAVSAPFDVTDYDAVHDGIHSVEAELGHHVDILVNNAGVAHEQVVLPFRELTREQWRPPIDLNIFGAFNTIKAVLDGMCDAGWGRIVQISSGSARHGQDLGVSMYATGKSGIEGFIRHLAAENGKFGVTANVLALGHQENLAALMPEEVIDGILTTIPIGRLGRPEEVGAACAYLASDEAGGMTGQTIDFNGGSQMR
jgi:3-oxoacyl-[acyl-carrier protein] reductase